MRENRFIIKLYLLVFFVATVCMWTFLVKLADVNVENVATHVPYAKVTKKDWHDYKSIASDLERKGLGEHGKPAYIEDVELKKLVRKISLQNGFNAVLSDLISVNRSVADIRHKDCRLKLYLSNLPNVSAIIIFNDEHFSVLLRSIHSLINRSPPELLKEIILVDDKSKRKSLLKPLDDYVAANFTNVQIVRLPKRTGLIGARLAGARAAKGKVLVFLDSHIEANYNWLPPLLEPIALNSKTVVCPFIDVIDDKTFSYTAQDEGARGGFNWIMDYKRMPLLPENLKERTEPFESPVMAGGLFAILADYFWELGGYDEGLEIWGGEQYELSFKIWMCGGRMVDAPCSRVGHIYRGERIEEPLSTENHDIVRTNYKRVAEVWMDEYKEFLYAHDEEYKHIKTGDLTKQKALREKLNCKSFKWFMENVAFDLVKYFPTIELPNFASGAIQSVAKPELCIDTLDREVESLAGLYDCHANKTHPGNNQNWALSAHRDLRIPKDRMCLRAKNSKRKADIYIWECLEEGGDQFWYYDPKKQWLVYERNGDLCLEAVLTSRSLRIDKCNKKNKKMKWKFGFVNETALAEFFDDIPDISYAL